MNEELKPCPFCGGQASIHEKTEYIYTVYRVACGNTMCGCKPSTPFSQKKVNAISKWNTRADGWISVDERLPEVDEYGDINVLVCMDDEFIAMATYDQNNGWELWAESGEVTHWQPLPKSPKGE